MGISSYMNRTEMSLLNIIIQICILDLFFETCNNYDDQVCSTAFVSWVFLSACQSLFPKRAGSNTSMILSEDLF